MKTETIHGHQIRCYDNEGETFDRYTVVYMELMEKQPNTYYAVGMSANPLHPQGFGQHATAMPGKHFGKRIKFSNLPADCRRLVEQDLLLEDA